MLRPATARLPEIKSIKEEKKKKKTEKVEVLNKIEKVPEEVLPFYKVVSEYLTSRPVTATSQKKTSPKASQTKKSFNSNAMDSLSTLVSPKGIPISFEKKTGL